MHLHERSFHSLNLRSTLTNDTSNNLDMYVLQQIRLESVYTRHYVDSKQAPVLDRIPIRILELLCSDDILPTD